MKRARRPGVDRAPVASAPLHDRDGRLGEQHGVTGAELIAGVLADGAGDVVAGPQHARLHRDALERPAVDDDRSGLWVAGAHGV
jgi:hypothetical protein